MYDILTQLEQRNTVLSEHPTALSLDRSVMSTENSVSLFFANNMLLPK